MPDQTEHIHYSDDDLFNPETHHEESDVNVRALVWVAVITVIFAVVTHFVLFAMYKGLLRFETRRKTGAPITQLQRSPDASVPQGQPLLQPFPRKSSEGDEVIAPYRNTPVTDLHDMLTQQKQMLTTYGWVDQQKGIVRIPIEQAKRLVVERGLPVQPGTAASDRASVPDTGVVPPATAPNTNSPITATGAQR